MFDAFVHYVPVWLVALFVTWLIYRTRAVHLNWTARDHAGGAIQSSHIDPTPRVGGVAVMFALFVSLIFNSESYYSYILLSSLPLFLVGLSEDVSLFIKPKVRLLVTAVSSLLMVFLAEVFITRTGLSGLDWLLSFSFVAVIFTVFTVSGLVHAINLVDGLNGLASGLALLSTFALFLVSSNVGDESVAFCALSLIGVLAGFFMINFPKGLVFLGDSGAYLVGFFLGWVTVILVAHNPDISPWAVILMFFWPVVDTVHAMVRRWSRGVSATEADCQHFHQLLRKLMADRFCARHSNLANPLASFAILLLASVPVATGVVYIDDQAISFSCFVLFAGMYALFYLKLHSLFDCGDETHDNGDEQADSATLTP